MGTIEYRESEMWPADVAKETGYLVGDETTNIGKETDNGVEFVRLMYSNPLPLLFDSSSIAATVRRATELIAEVKYWM